MPLCLLQTPPRNDSEWSLWSYSNYDVNNQIRQAVLAQKNVILPEYQLEPINWTDLGTWLENNQQAHIDFTAVLGQQSSDLLSVDLTDPNQHVAWNFLNFMELYNACLTLKIGP